MSTFKKNNTPHKYIRAKTALASLKKKYSMYRNVAHKNTTLAYNK